MVLKTNVNDVVVCIVGLGYVGMPLAEAFSKHMRVIGFDINEKKVKKLQEQYPQLHLTADPKEIQQGDVVIIAVPTPVTKQKEPDLAYVLSASKITGKYMKKGAVVVLESTYYPGVTEDIVGPILENESGLSIGTDFKIGYSPERVNPGDKDHIIERITKVVSGMDQETTDFLSKVYGTITTTYKAENIKTAEAAKVIENIQRDLNIALMNELSIIFSKIGIDTKAVLDAASTKWNFNRYTPGLVGGHCIPVDPYYLVYKAKELGYHPQVILAGRAINDHMPRVVANMVIRELNEVGKVIKGSKILVMGLTFKENVDDTRETPVVEVIKELQEFKCEIYGHDPFLTNKDIENFHIKLYDESVKNIDCVIIAVAHDQFKTMTLDQIKGFMAKNPILIDVRGMFKRQDVENKGFRYSTL
jgi:UDP-N-acetyl-D-glucosamine/UDP-N-acetyl-D-galactosamine dehydrogenase